MLHASFLFCLVHVALSLAVVATTTPTAADVPPERRRYSGLDRTETGITIRDGTSYVPAPTHLGASAYEPVRSIGVWSGLYAGLLGGQALGKNHRTAGGVIGYNWQNDKVVFGLEGEVTASQGGADRSLSNLLEAERDWTAAARARLGIAHGSILGFVTAGIATAGWIGRQQDLLGQTREERNHALGWVYGGGFEWRVTRSIGLRTELLHFDYRDRDFQIGGQAAPIRPDETVVRGALTFSFN